MNIVFIDIVRDIYWADRENLDILEICEYLDIKDNAYLIQYNEKKIKDDEEIARSILKKLNPDVIVYNYDFNVNESVIARIKNICNCVKYINNEILNIVIGYRALGDKANLKENYFVDEVFSGNPKEIATQVYKYIHKIQEEYGIENNEKVFDNNKIVVKRDIKLLKEIGKAKIRTNRGCVGNCSFCIDKDKKIEYRDISDVINEIDIINKSAGIANFMIYDNSFEDPFPKDKRRIYEFINCIKEKNWKFYFNCSIRAESFAELKDLELLKSLNKIGFYNIIVGFESGSSEDLLLFNKRASVDDNIRMASFLKKADINFSLVPGFIMFHPYSSIDTLKANIDFLFKIDRGFAFNAMVSSIKVVKGTDIEKRIKEDGLIDTYDINTDLVKYNYKDNNVSFLANFLIQNRYDSKAVRKAFKLDEARDIISKCKLKYCVWNDVEEFIHEIERNEILLSEYVKAFWENIFKNIGNTEEIKKQYQILEERMDCITVDAAIKKFFVSNYKYINSVI